MRVDTPLKPDGSPPSQGPHYQPFSLLRGDPSLHSALVLGPWGYLPLGHLPWHRSARFPRSAWKPDPGSRHLCAGHHLGSRQVAPRLHPEPTTGARFRWRPYAFDRSLVIHFRSPSWISADGYTRLFLGCSLPGFSGPSSAGCFEDRSCNPSPGGPPPSSMQQSCVQLAIAGLLSAPSWRTIVRETD